jgi:signal transduction histidine kinase
MPNYDIKQIINALESTYGESFLQTITMQLHKTIDADFTFITRIDSGRYVSETLALVAGDDFADNFEYSLQDTPCANVADNSTCIYPRNITHLFPKDELLIDMGIEGYIGAPLESHNGEVIGLVVALYKEPIEYEEDVASLFQLFSGRIAAEMERMDKEAELHKLNESLEQKVAYRTAELEKVVRQLRESKDALVEQEKQASLGRLVSGVAHEVNTPLGVAILGNSTIQSLVKELHRAFVGGQLSKRLFESSIADLEEATGGIEFNLRRASELVANFKQMASEFHHDEISTTNLNDWLTSISGSLIPMLKKSGVDFQLNLQEQPVVVETYPSRIAQVVTNIVSNSMVHAFPEEQEFESKQVTLSLSSDENSHQICIQDNGTGMTPEVLTKLFEPFFTTRRTLGGTGLGMSIVQNLVTGSLGGQLEVESEPGKGSVFRILFNKDKTISGRLLESFQRATGGQSKFYESFHARLVERDEKIAQLFSGVDLTKQKNMVIQSIELLIKNQNSLPELFAQDRVKQVVDMHKRMEIDSQLLAHWADSLVETVRDFDSEFSDGLGEMWQHLLMKFQGHFMKALSQS